MFVFTDLKFIHLYGSGSVKTTNTVPNSLYSNHLIVKIELQKSIYHVHLIRVFYNISYFINLRCYTNDYAIMSYGDHNNFLCDFSIF